MSRKWAQMNVGIKGRTDEMRDWFMQAVATVSGRRTAEGIAEWIREQNVLQDTGITLVRKDSSTLRMTAEEVQEWMRLTPEERREKREKMRQEAEGIAVMAKWEELLKNFCVFLDIAKPCCPATACRVQR